MIDEVKKIIAEFESRDEWSKQNNRKPYCPYDISQDPNDGVICVFVEDGDWKHDHLYVDYVMGQIGYEKTDEVTTYWDGGSDWCSSEHYFKKKG